MDFILIVIFLSKVYFSIQSFIYFFIKFLIHDTIQLINPHLHHYNQPSVMNLTILPLTTITNIYNSNRTPALEQTHEVWYTVFMANKNELYAHATYIANSG